MIHTNQSDIGQEDGSLSNNNHNENEGNEQEAEDIVDVALPNATEDERVLDEGSAEGEDTGQHAHHGGVHEPRLNRDCTRNQTDLLGQVALDEFGAVSSGATDENERKRDAEPQTHQD